MGGQSPRLPCGVAEVLPAALFVSEALHELQSTKLENREEITSYYNTWDKYFLLISTEENEFVIPVILLSEFYFH